MKSVHMMSTAEYFAITKFVNIIASAIKYIGILTRLNVSDSDGYVNERLEYDSIRACRY